MVSVSISGFKGFLSSLFPEPETFLRELVQNSMEALHAAAQTSGNSSPSRIDIEIDEAVPSITFRDNGCGMTRGELSEKMITVFRSGWQDGNYDSLGVGQFGFGFFSTMLVSDRLEVSTRSVLADDEGSIWHFDCQSGTSELRDVDNTLETHGFSVTLFLSEKFRHFASSLYISEVLQNYLLFCPFPITVGGLPLNVPTRAQWQRTLSDPRSISDVMEDVQTAFHWSEPPLGVKSFSDGVLAIAPSREEAAPATKVYRHGVFVLEAEIIPQPLNFIFCGIFNVDELNIRPDRKSFLDDTAAANFGARVLEQIELLFREISQEPRRSVAFFEGWLEPMIAGVMIHDELADLRQEMPLRLVSGRGISLTLETTWKNLTKKDSVESILFTRDPVADREMLEHFHGDSEPIVVLINSAERALASYCAKETGVRLVSISDRYLNSQKQQAEDHRGMTLLFSEARLSYEYDFVCVRDQDVRVPLKLMRENGEHEAARELLKMLSEAVGRKPPDGLLGEERWIGLINLSHPAVQALSVGLENGVSRARLRNGAELLLLTARMTSGADVSNEEQIAHATALGDLMADAFAVKSKGGWLPFSR